MFKNRFSSSITPVSKHEFPLKLRFRRAVCLACFWVVCDGAFAAPDWLVVDARSVLTHTEDDMAARLAFRRIDDPKNAFITVVSDISAENQLLSFRYKVFWQPSWIHDVAKYSRRDGLRSLGSFTLCFSSEARPDKRACFNIGERLENVPRAYPVLILKDRRGIVLMSKRLPLEDALMIRVSEEASLPADGPDAVWREHLRGEGLLIHAPRYYIGREVIPMREADLEKIHSITVMMGELP